MIDDLLKEVDNPRWNHGYREYIRNKHGLSAHDLRFFEDMYREQDKFKVSFKRSQADFMQVGRYFAGLEAYVYYHKAEVKQ